MSHNSRITLSLLCVLFLLSITAYTTTNVIITGDMSVYMNQALNILQGYGNVYDRFNSSEQIVFRGPVFPLLIAASFKLFGISLSSAFCVVKIFCIINVFLVFYLGKIIFGKAEGFLASILMILSPGLGFWSYRHLDSVWVSFILASLLLYVFYIEKKRPLYLFVSGALMGIAFLVKEVALLLFVYPLLLGFLDKKNRNKSYYVDMISYISGIFIALLPWGIYVCLQTGGLSALLGNLVRGGSERITFSLDISPLSKMLRLVNVYIKGMLLFPLDMSRRYSLVMVLFAFGWLYGLYKAWADNFYCKAFWVLMVLFTPVMAVTSKYYLRPGQINFFVIISYIVVGWFLVRVAQMLSKTLRVDKNIILAAFVFIICATDLTFPNQDSRKFLTDNMAVRVIRGKGRGPKYAGWYGDKPSNCFTAIGTWMAKNIPDGKIISHDLRHLYRPVYFHCRGRGHFINIPIRSLDPEDKYNINYDAENNAPGGTAIFLDIKQDLSRQVTWGQLRDGVFKPEHQFYAILKNDLLRQLENERADYVMVKERGLQINLDKCESFKEVASTQNREIVLYKVKLDNPSNYCNWNNAVITPESLKYLIKIKQDKPQLYDYFRKSFFHPVAGFDEVALQKLCASETNNEYLVINTNGSKCKQ